MESLKPTIIALVLSAWTAFVYHHAYEMGRDHSPASSALTRLERDAYAEALKVSSATSPQARHLASISEALSAAMKAGHATSIEEELNIKNFHSCEAVAIRRDPSREAPGEGIYVVSSFSTTTKVKNAIVRKDTAGSPVALLFHLEGAGDKDLLVSCAPGQFSI